jgi:hemolysin III
VCLHQVAFLVRILAGLALVALARATAAGWGAGVFATTRARLNGVSAAHHRGRWSAGARRLMSTSTP